MAKDKQDNIEQKIEELLELEPNSKDLINYIVRNNLNPELFMDMLDKKYTDFKTLKGGNSRPCFEAKRGLHELVFKFEVYDNNDNRGGTNLDEINALLGIPDPEENNIVQLIDFIDLTKYHGKGYMTMEKKFSDSSSLFDYIQKNGTLSNKQFEQVIPQVIKAFSHAYSKQYKGKPKPQILHRDPHAGNILVREDEQGNIDKVRVTDFATASKKQDLMSKIEQSATIHALSIQDPLLSYTFTGKETKYSAASELYSLGVNMYYALTGTSIFTFDSKNKIAIVNNTGKDLLDKDGRLNMQDYEKALRQALDNLAPDQIIYKDILYKLLNLKQRTENPETNIFYDSENPFEDLINDLDFIHSYKPDTKEKQTQELSDLLERVNNKPRQKEQEAEQNIFKRWYKRVALATGTAFALGALFLFGQGLYPGKDTKDMVFDYPPIASAAASERSAQSSQELEHLLQSEEPIKQEQNKTKELQSESTLEQTLVQDDYGLEEMRKNIKKGAYVNTKQGGWKDYGYQGYNDSYLFQHDTNGTLIYLDIRGFVKEFKIPTAVNKVQDGAYIDTKQTCWKDLGYQSYKDAYLFQHKDDGTLIYTDEHGFLQEFKIPTNLN